MNLKKLAYIYLPAVAITLAVAALVIAWMHGVAVNPVVYLVIIVMSLLIIKGINDEFTS